MPQLSERRIRHVPHRRVQGAWNQGPPRILFGILGVRPQLSCSSPCRIVGGGGIAGADECGGEGCFSVLQDSRENDMETSECARAWNWPDRAANCFVVEAERARRDRGGHKAEG